MATPFDELRTARSQLRQSKRALRDTREKLKDVIDDDTEDTNEVIRLLEDQEIKYSKRIEELESRIAELELSIDNERSQSARQEGRSRVALPTSPTAEKQNEHALSFFMSTGEHGQDSKRDDDIDNNQETPSKILSTTSTEQLSAADFGSLSVPLLKTPSCIGAHLSLLEQLFQEAGAGTINPNGVFVPHTHLRISVYNKLLKSVKSCEVVSTVIHDVAQNCEYKWSAIKSELQQEFARRDLLKAEYNSVMRSLAFGGLGTVEIFLRKALAAFRMYRNVYGTDRAELRTMTRTVVMKLPEKLRICVVQSLQSQKVGNGDWELALPFDDTAGRPSVISVIRTNCRTFRDAGVSLDGHHGLNNNRNHNHNHVKDSQHSIDRVAQVSDGKSGRGESLSKWAGRFPAVFVVTGPGVAGSPENHVQYDDARHYPRKDGKGVLWFLAYKDEENGSKVIGDLSSDQFETRNEDSILALSSATIPPEILLRGALRSTSSNTWDSAVDVPVLVDSGAGGNYLLVCDTDVDSLIYSSGALFTPSRSSDSVRSVSLADGSRRNISKAVDVTIGIYPVGLYGHESIIAQQQVSLNVLTVSPCPFLRPGSWCTLAGRSLLARWNLITKGSAFAKIGSVCVFRASPSDNCASEAYTSCLALCDDSDGAELSTTGVGIQPCCESNPSSIHVLPSGDIIHRIEQLLRQLSDQGWRPLARCPSEALRVKLRRLGPDEPRDTDIQAFCFTVDLSAFDKSKVGPQRGYARGLYNRLSPLDRETYAKLIKDYLDRKWWSPVEKSQLNRIVDISPPIPVFMIGGTSSKTPVTVRKPRLVLDCRAINEGLPSASSENPSGFLIINALRWASPIAIATIDAQQAFYRVQVSGLTLLLVSALGYYTSRRICFGLSPGPSSLQSSLGALFFLMTYLYVSGFWSLYVDDGILSGSVRHLIHNLTVLVYAMLLCGFAVQQTKFACICESSHAAELNESLKPLGIVPSGSLSLLRTSLCYRTGTLVLHCCREERLDRVYKFASSDTIYQLSKSAAFSYAGALSYDVGRVHPECRSCADGVRSLIGRCLAKQGWQTVVNLRYQLTPIQLAAYDYFIHWMRELSAPSAAKCSHVSPCPSNDELPDLTLVTDASRSGGGFLVLRGSVEGGSEAGLADLPMLCGDGFRWSRTQRNYHSNRRELLSLVIGLRACADLVSHYFTNSKDSTACGPRRRPKVFVLSDNKAVIHWSREDATALFSSGQALEKRALTRLVLVAMDELKALKRYADIEVRHVEGRNNILADRLSRLYDSVIAPGITLSDVLCDDLPDSVPVWPEESDDDIRLLAADSSHEPLTSCDPYTRDRLLLFRHCELESGDVSLDLRTDFIGLVAGSSAEALPCFIERLAAQCYDYSTILSRVRCLRFILRLLRANAVGAVLSVVEYSGVPCDADKRALVCAAQRHDEFCIATRSRGPLPCGPYVISDDGDSNIPLVLFRSGSPFGTEVFQYVLPKSVPRLREKVLKDAHSRSEHLTVRPTLSLVVDYHLPGATRQCRDFLSKCITCKTLRAQRSWSSHPSVRSEAAALAHLPPYWHVSVDFLAVGDHVKLFSAVCMFTRHITLFRAKTETSSEALRLLKLLKAKTGSIRIVTCDRAAYFRSSDQFIRRVESELEASVCLASSRSPWEICSESHNAIVVDRLRCMLRHSSGKWPSDRDDEDLLLERLMSIINCRPLGTFLISQGTAEVVTPDSLYFGRTRDGSSSLSGSKPTSTDHSHLMPNRLKTFRNVFLSSVWSELKKQSLSNVSSKCKSGHSKPQLFYPGDAVLVHMTGRKCGMAFRMGHVVRVFSPRRVQVRFPGGLLTYENAFNLVILRPFPRLDPNIPVVSREGLRLRVQDDQKVDQWRSGVVTYDPCDVGDDRVWIQFDNGDTPEFISLGTRRWQLSDEETNNKADINDYARVSSQGGRDETEDCLIEEPLPSRVGMRISVATGISAGLRRPRRYWSSGRVCGVRRSGALDILWDGSETAGCETIRVDDTEVKVLR